MVLRRGPRGCFRRDWVQRNQREGEKGLECFTGRGKALANVADISKDNLIDKWLGATLRLIPWTAVLSTMQGLLRGKKRIVSPASHDCRLRSHEFHKQRALQKVLSIRDVVYDIGANVAFDPFLASVLVGVADHVYFF